MDKELDPALTQRVKSLAAEIPSVVKVQKYHTRKMGIMNHADLHIWVVENMTVAKGDQVAHKVKDTIQQSLPQFIDVMIHVEPTNAVD